MSKKDDNAGSKKGENKDTSSQIPQLLQVALLGGLFWGWYTQVTTRWSLFAMGCLYDVVCISVSTFATSWVYTKAHLMEQLHRTRYLLDLFLHPLLVMILFARYVRIDSFPPIWIYFGGYAKMVTQAMIETATYPFTTHQTTYGGDSINGNVSPLMKKLNIPEFTILYWRPARYTEKMLKPYDFLTKTGLWVYFAFLFNVKCCLALGVMEDVLDSFMVSTDWRLQNKNGTLIPVWNVIRAFLGACMYSMLIVKNRGTDIEWSSTSRSFMMLFACTVLFV